MHRVLHRRKSRAGCRIIPNYAGVRQSLILRERPSIMTSTIFSTAKHEKTSPAGHHAQAPPHPRISRADADARRTQDPQSSTAKRPLATHPSLIRATFRARERLRRTSRFWAVRRHGTLARGHVLSVWALRNDGPVTRVGLRIQRGLKGSVARNRSKRLMREVIRRHKADLAPGWDLVITIHRIRDISQLVIQQEVINLLSKLRVLR